MRCLFAFRFMVPPPGVIFCKESAIEGPPGAANPDGLIPGGMGGRDDSEDDPPLATHPRPRQGPSRALHLLISQRRRVDALTEPVAPRALGRLDLRDGPAALRCEREELRAPVARVVGVDAQAVTLEHVGPLGKTCPFRV
jgi:hypothetical protein